MSREKMLKIIKEIHFNMSDSEYEKMLEDISRGITEGYDIEEALDEYDYRGKALITYEDLILEEKKEDCTMSRSRNVKVNIKIHISSNDMGLKNLIKYIEEKMFENEEYKLEVLKVEEYTEDIKKIHVIMSTQGTYEENLRKFSSLHSRLEEVSNELGIKYEGISLTPNEVDWDI